MRLTALMMMICLLAACGQTGALYLPDDPPPAAPKQDPASREQP